MTLLNAINNPLSLETMKKYKDDDNYIEGYIKVSLSEVIDNDLEGFLDLISERLTGTCLLMDINYRIVGSDPANDTISLAVSGDVSSIIGMEDQDE